MFQGSMTIVIEIARVHFYIIGSLLFHLSYGIGKFLAGSWLCFDYLNRTKRQ